ncbi:MAG: helix-turn-helix domain-containing protein [Gemmatimonadaceae bacterium]
METIVEVTASESTRAALQKPGPLKHVRFVSTPSVGGSVRRVVVARISDFEKRSEELQRLIVRGTSFAAPLVVVALQKDLQTFGGLQLLTLLSSRLGSKNGDPFVSPTVDAARRVLKAHALGSEKHLVAYATVKSGMLSVWSCEPRLYCCSSSDIPALAGLSADALKKVTVSASGSRLHWTDGDVDLDMDTIREFTDPKARKEAESKYRTDAIRYGSAIRRVRESQRLRQGKIAGLSEREVRRIENGEVLPHSDTLRKLAEAHGCSVSDYMGRVATESKTRTSSHRK